MDNEGIPIIIDNGSRVCKGGLSNEETPSVVFPQCIGRVNSKQLMLGVRDYFVGEDAIKREKMLNINYPVENGIINNWDDIELIWNNCIYNEIRVDPFYNPVMLTEDPFNTKTSREKTTEFFFESLLVPQFSLQQQAVLSLYASGRTTGLVIDSGYGSTRTVPVYEGYALKNCVNKIILGGKDLTEYMERNIDLSKLNIENDKIISKEIKEKLCYVAINPQLEAKIYENSTEKNKDYKLPDGKDINIKNQRYKCPEILFDPQIIEKNYEGIHFQAFQSIQMCDIELRQDLYKNIVLAGGSTLFQGISERLNFEIKKLLPANMEIQIESSNGGEFSTWLGGKILSNLSSFQPNWITKKEYEENGINVVHRKCI